MKPTNSLSQIPLTIFDLVEPTSLHKLYGMLALALDEDVIVEQEAKAGDDTQASSHMSIIIPAKKFRHTSIIYEMTVSDMLFCEGPTSLIRILTLTIICFTRLYSWNISSPENEIFLDGLNQL